MSRQPDPSSDRLRQVESVLAGLAPAELDRLSTDARRRLRGPSGEGPRTVRSLDPLPAVFDASTWSQIEAGVAQRIRLLEALLADLYGPARLVREGLLPPEIAFASPGYLHNTAPPPLGRWLSLAAVDVAIAADGTPLVVGDRTGFAAGLGTSQENRAVTATILATLFGQARVRRTTAVLDALRASLAELAARTGAAGRVVLLSPPVTEAGHDEAAYLARTLGYTLAEGADLTVRRGALHLRSLADLEPVQVVFRLVADPAADPLDLDPASVAGTPGLLAAARHGTVTVVNPLGAGWAGRRTLSPFLGALANAVLGEELILASPPSWWCGGPDRDAVLDRLSQLVLYSVDGDHPVDGRRLTAAQLGELRSAVLARPDAWVARQPPELASSLCYVDGRRVTEQTVTRVFAAVRTDDVAVVGAGGLTRLVGAHGPEAVSKDTWVLSADELVEPAGRVVPADPIDLATSLPVRAGEALFWLGRHAERAEAMLRLGRVIGEYARIVDKATGWQSEPPWLSRLAGTLASLAALPASGESATAVVRAALTDRTKGVGLAATIGSLAANAAAVDELLPAELHAALRDVTESALGLDPATASDTPAALDETLQALAAVAGLAQEALVRGPGWRLLDAGRRLERCLAVIGLLQTIDAPTGDLAGDEFGGLDADHLDAVLSAAISLIAYRRSYRTEPEPSAVRHLLVHDAANPRSLRFQLDALTADLDHLAIGPRRPARILLVRAAQDLVSHLGDLGALRAGLVDLSRMIELEYIAQVPANRLRTGTRS